jgi:NAD(P)-dependent dehydrogenase (short-subunit alcohol dehydrogenase family)
MATNLDGQAALVTGGSRGIGFAIASALLARGAAVVITGTTDGHLKEARKRLEPSYAGRVLARRADVRDMRDAEESVGEAVRAFGGLDILVNNAGVGAFAPVANLSLEDWNRVIDTNLTGVFHCCRAAIPALRRRGGGCIINISSLAGKNPFPDGAAYCASKAALNAFSESLMQEVRYDGIRVSYVMPGSVRTDFRGQGAAEGGDWKLAPEDVAQVVVDLIAHPPRSLPSRVEIRPSQPRK